MSAEKIKRKWEYHLMHCVECAGGRFFCVVAQDLSKSYMEAKRLNRG